MGAPVTFPGREQEVDVRAERGTARSDVRARPTTAPDPLLGRVLDRRYRITERIARGGMASVYIAHDLRLDRTVAVKVMHPGMGDDEQFAGRFVREARAAARLSHPNVVAVYDQGEDEGAVFLAMEYVPGHTLRDTIAAHSPMPPAKALGYLEPVLGALAAAHRAGLVHRDVKPENVLISEDAHSAGGRIKVADFGLARAVTAETQHTSTGVLIGTVSYIAPELVIEGKADARADVYSAGVLLYELLTGRKPHTGETPIQVAYKHVHDDVPPPSRSVPGIPAYVDALVARATARDRDLRPADAGVLLHQVRRVANALAAGIDDDPELTADLALPVHTTEVEDTEVEDTESYDAPSPVEPTTALPTRLPSIPPDRTVERLAAPSGRPRSRRRWPRLVALVLGALLLVALAGGGWWLLLGRYEHTPGVVGLTKADAVSRLHHAGLEVRSRAAYSDTVPKGQVITSDPERGERILEGHPVTITVSRGVEQYAVPKLAGKSVDDAEDALVKIKMDVPAPVERWSETVPAGQVIKSKPKAGTVLRPGHTVTLVVSKGRQPIKVGDWVHHNAAKAKAALHKRGLKVELQQAYADDVPKGQVISQSPEDASTTLHRGDTVTLLVSRGPHLVTVPSVLGHGVDAATDELKGKGFEVEVRHYTPYFGLRFVMSQESRGEKIPYGSTVVIYIS